MVARAPVNLAKRARHGGVAGAHRSTGSTRRQKGAATRWDFGRRQIFEERRRFPGDPIAAWTEEG
jgi:hypothetical protein